MRCAPVAVKRGRHATDELTDLLPSLCRCLACRVQFKTNLPNVSVTDATGLVVKITGVTAIEGDVTVGQRKSK